MFLKISSFWHIFPKFPLLSLLILLEKKTITTLQTAGTRYNAANSCGADTQERLIVLAHENQCIRRIEYIARWYDRSL